ncbi:hypothetical protein [Vibrio hangzhouensis]|uniref:hypothetical protein n=1 Tax=Vibrio hangzhouensis TaxID=462991 RepID=UPI001C94C800|nr:hypothetical protein [Vibrio hangzhouensis]MBY6197361.1 hypothetical protein [Vibrio hangzhouensis]
MNVNLLEWYQSKHSDFKGDNLPSASSQLQLEKLTNDILIPIESEFGAVTITYGFNCHQLLRYIQRHSPSDTAPAIDQHASMEHNSKGNRICQRDGAACDFTVVGYEEEMECIAHYIITTLKFDRLYYYGSNKPLHVSIGSDNARYVQIRRTKSDGRRVAGPSRTGLGALELFTYG